jgi:hypothetical protein
MQGGSSYRNNHRHPLKLTMMAIPMRRNVFMIGNHAWSGLTCLAGGLKNPAHADALCD